MIRNLTAAQVTRLAREAVFGNARFTTETIAPGAFRVRPVGVTDPGSRTALLTEVRNHLIRFGYDASVSWTRPPRGEAVGAIILTVIDTPRRDREIQEQEERHMEALPAAPAETTSTQDAPTGELRHAADCKRNGGVWADPCTCTPRYWTRQELDAEAAAARRAEELAMRRPDGCPTCAVTIPGKPCFGCGTVTPVGDAVELDAERPEPGPVSLTAIADDVQVVRRDGVELGRVRAITSPADGWVAWDAHGIRRVDSTPTPEEAARLLVAGIDRRASQAAEQDAWEAEEAARWAPDEVLPSGRYGVKVLEPDTHGGGMVLQVVQRITRPGRPDRWAPTPGRYAAHTLTSLSDAAALMLDHGAGWGLDGMDTRALRLLARRTHREYVGG